MSFIRNLAKAWVSSAGTKNDSTREAWVRAALSGLPEGSRLLDAGAGQQRYRPDCSRLRYVSQDFCQYDGKGEGSALHSGKWDTTRIDIVSDILAIPEPGESFDAILFTEVFEHVPEPAAALAEFNRLLRPGGELILTAPFCSLTHMAPYHYYSGFNKYFFLHFLPKTGFEILELTPNGDYAEYLAQELRRLPSLYGRLPLAVAICYRFLLRFLGNARNEIAGTSELLCYGYQVRARKRGGLPS
jgi:SAM-dependent methyltransferase